MTDLFNPDYLITVNSTDRTRGGTVSTNPLVYRYLIQNRLNYPWQDWHILDFGAGYTAKHTKALYKSGYSRVYAYDIGKNWNVDEHLSPERYQHYKGTWDMVIASNVLNVQPSYETVAAILQEMYSCLSEKGFMLFNFPYSPRKNPLNDNDMENLLIEMYGTGRVEIDKKFSKSSRLYFVFSRSIW